MRKPYATRQILPGIVRVFYTEQEYLKSYTKDEVRYIIHPFWIVALLTLSIAATAATYVYFIQ